MKIKFIVEFNLIICWVGVIKYMGQHLKEPEVLTIPKNHIYKICIRMLLNCIKKKKPIA